MIDTKTVTAGIVITRSQNGRGEYAYSITVRDEKSGRPIAAIRLSPEDFAGAVTALWSKCEATLYPEEISKYGKIIEHKHVAIPVGSARSDKEIAEVLSVAVIPHETDGWKAQDIDEKHLNLRNLTGDHYHVTFERYIEKGE